MTAPDMQDVIGQAHAKRALEVAAAGGHHVFLIGPTGAGKTLLANALWGIMPGLTQDEIQEVASIAGTPYLRDRLLELGKAAGWKATTTQARCLPRRSRSWATTTPDVSRSFPQVCFSAWWKGWKPTSVGWASRRQR